MHTLNEKCSHFQTPHSNTLSQTLSNTLSKFKHSHSNTQISHPQLLGMQQNSPSHTQISHHQPLGVQQNSPSPSNALLFPHNWLQMIPLPIPSKSLLSLPTEVQIFSSLKICFLICMFIYRELRNEEQVWMGLLLEIWVLVYCYKFEYGFIVARKYLFSIFCFLFFYFYYSLCSFWILCVLSPT